MSRGFQKRIALICLVCLIVAALCGATFADGVFREAAAAELPAAAERTAYAEKPARTVTPPAEAPMPEPAAVPAVPTAPEEVPAAAPEVPALRETAGASAAEPDTQRVPVYVCGIRVCDGVLLDGTAYVPVRAFCAAMCRDVCCTWDAETETATVTLERGDAAGAEEPAAQSLVMTLRAGDGYLTANGRCFYAAGGIRLTDGKLTVPVRSIASAFGAEVVWDGETRSICVDASHISVPETGDTFYDAEDLYWLSHIIFAESGNQPLEGMIGVGNVVLNRVKDPGCPDTVYGVIFDRRYGVQFSPAETGTVYDEPNEMSIAAAKLCLEGCSVVGDSLFFVNPAIGVSRWFTDTRTCVAAIGDHVFYA